jgi:hypothetical protein
MSNLKDYKFGTFFDNKVLVKKTKDEQTSVLILQIINDQAFLNAGTFEILSLRRVQRFFLCFYEN